MKLNKTYKFAIKSSLFITLLSFVAVLGVSFFLTQQFNFLFTTIISLFIFIISIVIIQYRVEHFIYKRIKSIYEEVAISKAETLNKISITSDMDTLSEKLKKFADDKHLEIEMLQIREEYRREFLGNVSHELKTPLFTVQGYLLTLTDGAIKDSTIREKYLSRANKGVERLISIVEDLDMITQLESGSVDLSYESFNIINLIQNVFDLLELKAKKRTVLLRFDKIYDTPILVHGDVKRIEQVLINLIENSIKYGKQRGASTVSILSYSNSQFIIHITDEGEGIKPQHLSRLFERFYRVDPSRSREQGGSGLGLSIVKHIIEAHQQKVFVESELGRGSTFSFTLEKFK
ncbi:MAG TPA: two-component sensor histidine kinase [Flavobacteriaceae bacterium]|nr:two-component sensor histidine kinase [Flavobacteriaceae bacterium]HBS13132.1 two-component sensor histidine kinase [Flavobacteriaceae bacterium]